MSLRESILPGLEVLTSDGVLLGTVAKLEGDTIGLAATGAAPGTPRQVPLALVARVDRHVHLNVDRAGVDKHPAAAASPAAADAPIEGPLPPVRNPAVGNARPRGNYYLPYVLGGLLLLLLLFGLLRGCDSDEDDREDRRPVVTQGPGREAPRGRYETGTIAYELDRFLASGDPAPRTLSFERLNFDTGSAAVRQQDVPISTRSRRC
jgi:hypothetical protein